MIEHLKFERTPEDRREIAKFRPQKWWHPGKYFHIGPIHLHDWASWFLFGQPIDIVGHGKFSGHVWRLKFTTKRSGKLFNEAEEIEIVVPCENCLAEIRRVRASCDHV